MRPEKRTPCAGGTGQGAHKIAGQRIGDGSVAALPLPTAPRWAGAELAEIADAEDAAREEAWLDDADDTGRRWAAARGPRAHDREWAAGIGHGDEFGRGGDR
ncbi:MAG: hypothetical protein QM733_18970 [Ilumatobacteraceae bacterium]